MLTDMWVSAENVARAQTLQWAQLYGDGSKVGNVQARSAKPDIPENTLSRFGWYRRFVNSQSSGQYRLTDDKITV